MHAPWAMVVAVALLQAAPPSAAHGMLAGVVLDSETAAPVAGAIVHVLGPAARRLSTARSGLDGRWSVTDLPQGVYRIIALAPGFAPAWARPRGTAGDRPGGSGISLDAGRRHDNLVARLERAGSISGQVTTAAGAPVPDVVVTIDGAPAMGAPRVGQAVTDREGRYRLDDVAAGERWVVVLPNPIPARRVLAGQPSRFFHPGTTNRTEARTVTVRAGEHAAGIDIIVTLPDAYVLTGALFVPAGAGNVQVRLLSNGGRTLRNLWYLPEARAVGPDIVEAGRYVVWARGRDGESTLAAWQAVEIAGDRELPAMSLAPTGVVRGRVRPVPGAPLPPGGLAVTSRLWIDGAGIEVIGEHEAPVAADGSFELSGILGPRRLAVRGLPAGWEVVDLRVANASVLVTGIDVGPAQTVEGVEVVVATTR